MMTKDGFYTDNMTKGEGILIEVLGEGGGRYMVIPNHKCNHGSTPTPLRIRPDSGDFGKLMLKVGDEVVAVPEGVEVELYFDKGDDDE